MKRYLATLAVFALGALSSFGSPIRPGFQNQFHVPHAGQQSEEADAQAKINREKRKPAFAKSHSGEASPGRRNTRQLRTPRRMTHNHEHPGICQRDPIPAGGTAYNRATLGDFNGDGKKDLLTVVRNHVGGFPECGTQPTEGDLFPL